MFTKKSLKLVTLLTLTPLIFTSLLIVNSKAQQKSYDYKMPFRWNEVWDTYSRPGAENVGVHTDRTGFAMDIMAPANSTLDVLAPSAGVITRGCSVGNATFLTFLSDYGDTFRFVHIQGNTTGLNNRNDSRRVNQGDVIGKIYGAGTYDAPGCSLTQDSFHVHFSWLGSACPLKIEGYVFDCNGMQPCISVYLVTCNRKHTNISLLSTNGINLDDNYCNSLLTKNWIRGEQSEAVKYLQVCLRKKGMFDFDGGYTGYYGDYTAVQLTKWKNQFQPNFNQNDNWIQKGLLKFNNIDKALLNYNLKNGEVMLFSLNQDGSFKSKTNLQTVGTDWKVESVKDFDGDGITDIFWRNIIDGRNAVWHFNNAGVVKSAANLAPVPMNSGWFVAGAADFNNDKISDVVWRNDVSNVVFVWILNKNSQYSRSVQFSNVNVSEWDLVEAKDMNNDGYSEIFWRNKIIGNNTIWIVDKNSAASNAAYLSTIPVNSGWKFGGVGDFDNNKFGDVFWRNDITGETAIWKLNNNLQYVKSYNLEKVNGQPNSDKSWNPILLDDVNSDGTSDIFWRGLTNKQISVWRIKNDFSKIEPSIVLPVLEGKL